jgi:sortase A
VLCRFAAVPPPRSRYLSDERLGDHQTMKATRHRLLLCVERTSWAIGLVGLLSWGAFQVGVATSTKHDLQRFVALQAAAPPDQSLWSPERVSAWRQAQAESASTASPLAVLRIPKIRLEVPLLPGTDDRTLDRAVGHIEDTAQPGTDGNLGIAGHRDGFFRGLKDIAPGDVIELDTLQGKNVYRVERTWVVSPDDVSVLNPTSARTLTLVTCYPFYFVGSAPLRFIVRAVHVAETEVANAAVDRTRSSCAGGRAVVSGCAFPHTNDRVYRSEMERVL